MSELATSRTTDEVQIAYSYWVSQLTYLSPRLALKFKTKFPTFESWDALSPDARSEAAKSVVGDDSVKVLPINFYSLMDRAISELKSHKSRGIQVVPIDSDKYPYLLKQIADPPLILFVRGPLEVLTTNMNAAVIGTRDTTPTGMKVATRIAKWLGENNWCIVSGLAKGIDSAAHRGALDAKAPTVAVMATALDTVYPAENRLLAQEILDAGGCWVGETPLRKKPHRGAFVQRDRIQSGLSVAVIPVQTDVEGGTMHTVRFTQQQHRMLLCPRPIEAEQSLKQYAGIRYLIESKKATPFSSEEYSQTLESMLAYRKSLLKDWTPEQKDSPKVINIDTAIWDEEDKKWVVLDHLKTEDLKTEDKTEPRKPKRKTFPRLQEGFGFLAELEKGKETKAKRPPKKQLETKVEILEQLDFDIEQAKHPDGTSLVSANDVRDFIATKIKNLKLMLSEVSK